MNIENIATPEVINKHMASINAMFDTSGKGENLWYSLTEKERELFCTQAGLQRSTAQIPLSKMRPDTRKQLLQTIKAIARASAMFRHVSFCDFGGVTL